MTCSMKESIGAAPDANAHNTQVLMRLRNGSASLASTRKRRKKPADQGSKGPTPPALKAFFFPQTAPVQLPGEHILRSGDSTRPKASAIFGPVRAQDASTLGAAGAAKKEVLNDAGVSRSSLPAAVPAPPTPKPSELRVGLPIPVKAKVTPGPKQTKLCFGASSSR